MDIRVTNSACYSFKDHFPSCWLRCFEFSLLKWLSIFYYLISFHNSSPVNVLLLTDYIYNHYNTNIH